MLRYLVNGFGEEKEEFEEWCCNNYQETHVDTKEKYLANEAAYLYYEQHSFPEFRRRGFIFNTEIK